MGKNTVISTFKRQVVWLTERWEQFFFQPVDSLPLSILRILFGGMLLYTHVVWGLAFKEFFWTASWNTPELVAQLRGDGFTPSLWWYIPDQWMNLTHWICNLVIVLFILGWGGRVTALLTWMIAVSYAHRASLANFGLDQINCILALYLVIGPSTQYLSLDRWLANRRLRTTADNKPRGDALSPSANLALRLIQIHLCIIYLWAGLGKLQGEAWWTGESMWLALANLEYQSMDMTWLASFPRLLEILTHATIFWELSFSALVWPKATRWLVLGIGVTMHLGIGIFLGMWTFGSIMIFAYMSFASGPWLRKHFGLLNWQELRVRSSLPSANESLQADWSSFNQPESSNAPFLPLASATSQQPEADLPAGSRPALISLDAQPAITEKTIVLISTSQACVDHFLQMNSVNRANWLVVHSLKEAESLMHLLHRPTFLMLEMRTLNNSDVQYLSIRVVKAKKIAHHRDSDSLSKRVFPK